MLRPNSLDPALKLTSKLLGVHTLLLTNQQDSSLFTFDTGLGPFFFQTNLAAMILSKGTDVFCENFKMQSEHEN